MNQEEKIIIFENEIFKVTLIKSLGWNSPKDEWFDQQEEETVFLRKGNAVLQFENIIVELKEGEKYTILPHRKHRVSYTSSDCEWICIYRLV